MNLTIENTEEDKDMAQENFADNDDGMAWQREWQEKKHEDLPDGSL